jgi:hypothetical protein
MRARPVKRHLMRCDAVVGRGESKDKIGVSDQEVGNICQDRVR